MMHLAYGSSPRWLGGSVSSVSSMEPQYNCPSPFGTVELHRAQVDRTGTLQAWDGADLLLLDHVRELELRAEARVLVIGDTFGALTTSLQSFSTVVLNDSAVSEKAIASNLGRNPSLASGRAVRFVDSALDTEELIAECGGPFDLVVWNVARTTDAVSHAASLLSDLSHHSTVVLAGGLDKNLPPRTGDILRSVGEVTTHPGRRKAHVFSARPFPGESGFRKAEPTKAAPITVIEHQLVMHGGPGVFSSDRFDLGTRLLAGQVSSRAESLGVVRTVVDLGCGSGVLGILALRHFPEAEVHFIDDSRTAVATARRNVSANAPSFSQRAHFRSADVFGDDWTEPIDVVLCNPPFHHTKAMSDEVAWQMFVQSHRHLAPGGELWVVGNRHLGYHAKLTRLFGNVRQLDVHPKFVVLASTR